MSSREPLTPAESAANHGPGIIAGNLVVAILATMAVALRFLARHIQKIGFRADDYLILVALPFGWAMCACALIDVHYGLGRHIHTVSPEHLLIETKTYFASELIWAIAILPMKLSILLLYIRLFGPLKYLRTLAYGLGAFSACWSVTVVLVLALQCRPLQMVWDYTITGSCIDVWHFFIAGSAPNVLADFAILILPLPAVWNLKMNTGQKISVVGTLLLGSLTCIIGLVRLATLIHLVNNNDTTDLTWVSSDISIWSTAEPCLGIVAACLPTLRPILHRVCARGPSHILKRQGSNNTFQNSTFTSETLRKGHPGRDIRHFQPLDDSRDDIGLRMFSTTVNGIGDDIESLDEAHGVPMNSIKVHTRWENVREPA